MVKKSPIRFKYNTATYMLNVYRTSTKKNFNLQLSPTQYIGFENQVLPILKIRLPKTTLIQKNEKL